ncbi:MAG: hypothetical protein E6Q97_03305 [Desulfurellales bacterium]|nr:MAG: hypothetical protein E6Q97_03305 [Desulfurellales bacterium]
MKKDEKLHPRAEHPLFPFPADAQDLDLSTRDISWIYVMRGGETAPKRWPAAELLHEQQILDAYGGGQYTLRARNEAMSRWTASREVRLPGAPKPLHEAELVPAAPSAPTNASVPEISSPGLRDALAVAAVLGPFVLQMLEAGARRAEAQTNLLVQVLANKNPGMNEQMMQTLLSASLARNPGQETFGLMQQAMTLGMQMGANSQGGGDGEIVNSFVEGMSQVVELERLKKEQAQARAAKPHNAGQAT